MLYSQMRTEDISSVSIRSMILGSGRLTFGGYSLRWVPEVSKMNMENISKENMNQPKSQSGSNGRLVMSSSSSYFSSSASSLMARA